MNRFLYISFAFAVFLICNSCDTPLSKYEPKNDDEKSILELLNTYIDARNNGKMESLASLFDGEGQYISGKGAVLTKRQIADSKPDWWLGTGKLKLFNSEFTIDGSQATVKSTGKWGVHFKNPHTCWLVKKDGKWKFIKVKVGN